MRQLLIPVLALGFFFGLKLPIPAQEDARGILEKAINTQLPPLLAAILELLLQGYNGIEIAHRLDLEPKRVYRAMEWLRGKIMEETEK